MGKMVVPQNEIEGFLLSLNDKLADEISHLRDEIRFLRDMNSKLVDKVLGITNNPAYKNPPEDLDPIGRGYVPLRERIGEKEAQSMKDEIERMDRENASKER